LLDADKVQLAIKKHVQTPDSAALLLVDNKEGLIVLNGRPATNEQKDKAALAYQGTDLDLWIHASITALLPADNHIFGIQGISEEGVVVEPYAGTFTIIADTVRSTD
jgi:hypothetical protein